MITQYSDRDLSEKDKEKGKYKRNVYVFLVCLLISTFVWILIRFSKDYTTTLSYPVVFMNKPSTLFRITNVDTVLRINLRAQGFHLLKNNYFSSLEPLIIDVNKLHFVKKAKSNDSYILTSTLIQQITSQLEFQNTIFDISPDTLFFKFEKLSKKKVPVHLCQDLNFEKQYLLYDSIQFLPKSVWVSGSQSVIDTLKYVTTSCIHFDNLKEDKSLFVPIVNSNYTTLPEQIKVNIDVEQFTEGTLEIPVKFKSDNQKVKLFPDKVQITYLVALKDYKKVTNELFEAQVNLLDVKHQNESKLKVSINKFPAYLKITRIYPEKVEYIIVK